MLPKKIDKMSSFYYLTISTFSQNIFVEHTWSGNPIISLKFLCIPAALVIWHWRRLGALKPYLMILLIAFALTLLPAWLVVHVRERYFAKLFPAFVALVTAGCMKLSETDKRLSTTFVFTGLATIAWQLVFFHEMAEFSHMK